MCMFVCSILRRKEKACRGMVQHPPTRPSTASLLVLSQPLRRCHTHRRKVLRTHALALWILLRRLHQMLMFTNNPASRSHRLLQESTPETLQTLQISCATTLLIPLAPLTPPAHPKVLQILFVVLRCHFSKSFFFTFFSVRVCVCLLHRVHRATTLWHQCH